MKTQQDRSYLRPVPTHDTSPDRRTFGAKRDDLYETSYLMLVPEELAPTAALHAHSIPKDAQSKQTSSQQLLLPLPSEQLITIINMPRMTTSMFVRYLETVRPRQVLDMRLCPLFSIDHWMNNQRAFALFEKIGTRYDNIALFLELKFGVKTDNDARLNPAIVATLLPKLPKFFPRSGFPWPLQGPLAFLVDDPIRATDYEIQIPLSLKPAPPGGWYTVILG